MYRIDLMTPEDVPEVCRVERRCFSNPWPASAYRRELQAPEQNYYVVLREGPAVVAQPRADGPGEGNGTYPVERLGADGAARAVARRTLLPLGLGRRAEGGGGSANGARSGPSPVLGFAGMWVLYDEAHVTTIGVEPAHRGRSLGELLLVAMFDEARRRGANWLTLEVRVSNEPAQRLYRKYGFSVQGTRKRYYSDNNEDAHIMWSRPLQDPAYQAELAALRDALFQRLGHEPVIARGRRAGVGGRRPPVGGRRSAAG